MKRILVLTFILALSLYTVCFAATKPVPEPGSIMGISDIEMYAGPMAVPDVGSIAGMKDKDIGLTRGCCSHHKGVCGCDNGRVVCCDGNYSPSCGC